MKTIVVLLLIVLALPMYAQIPNGGFEDWQTVEGIEIPAAPWVTNNLQKKPLGVAFNPVTKSTDHYPANVGSYSVRLENNIAYHSESGELLPYWACSYGYTTAAFFPGYAGPVFPVTGHPDSLCGYYKFMPQNNDTMAISVGLYYQGELVTFATYYNTATVSSWTSFSIPLPAYTQVDSAQIGFSAFYVGMGLPKGPYGNSVLYIDNVIFKSTVSALETDGDAVNPVKFSLAQNYPNPFNPVTQIGYTLAHATPVQLEVFDLLGRKVATLLDTEQPAGQHRVTFDGSQFSAGVYLYRLQAGSFTQTRKLVLIK